MKLLLNILGVALVHVLFFSAYPQTGPTGNIYLAVSALVWCGFLVFVNTATWLVRFLSGAAGLVINAAVFALMALSLAATMPQRDGTAVLAKLRGGDYPSAGTLAAGLGRFGIDVHKEVKTARKDLERKKDEALDRIKEGK